MSHVIVISSNARTIKIPTTPAKYLTEVRDEACQKFKVNRDEHTLRYRNKLVDLSQQIRLANLPQAARLELVQVSRSPSVISVALQLPKSRLTQKFASNTTLWEILRYFESGDRMNYNFTQRGVPATNGECSAGQLNYETPVVTILPGHKEQSTMTELQQTLSQLGFHSGSALLKLTFRDSGTSLEEAMTQMSQFFQAAEALEVVNHGITQDSEAQGDQMVVDDKSQGGQLSESGMVAETDSVNGREIQIDSASSTVATSTEPTVRGQTDVPCVQITSQPRAIKIFAASRCATPRAARDEHDANDYVPLVEHVKAHQAALVSKQRNTRLLSDQELAEQKKVRQEKMKAAGNKGGVVRIRMPEGTLIQMDFTKEDTASGLYEFVESLLEKKEAFQLRYTGRMGQLVLIQRDDQRLGEHLHFFPNETVTFQWADEASAEVRGSQKILADAWQAIAQPIPADEATTRASTEPLQISATGTGSESKKKTLSPQEKESKIKNLLGNSLFRKK